MDSSKIVALMGPSGVGKGYTKSLIVEEYSDISQPIVVTTRLRRADDGESRRAGISIEEFEMGVEKGDILLPHRPFEDESTPLYGFDAKSLNQPSILTELHPAILKQFKEATGDKLLVLAMVASPEFLRQAMLQRDAGQKDIELRVKKVPMR